MGMGGGTGGSVFNNQLKNRTANMLEQNQKKTIVKGLEISLVDDIKNRDKPQRCSLNRLNKDIMYSLLIENSGTDVKPYRADNLSYDKLRMAIFRNTVPSDVSTVYVAPFMGLRREGVI